MIQSSNIKLKIQFKNIKAFIKRLSLNQKQIADILDGVQNLDFRWLTRLIFRYNKFNKMEQELPKQMINKSQEDESKEQKQESQNCEAYQRPSNKLQNAIKDKFPSYAKKYLNLDVKINSDIKLSAKFHKKLKDQGSSKFDERNQEVTNPQIGWKQYNSIFKAFLKYTNTNFDPQEKCSEVVDNIITRISSELRYNQRRNFKRSFYYLTITSEKNRATYVMRNCFGEITRMSVQDDSSKGLPRFITQNIRQLDNLVIIIHEFKGFNGQVFSYKNQYFIEKLNKCVYFKKQDDRLVLQNMFFQKSANLQARKYKRLKTKTKGINKGKSKQQKTLKKRQQKQNQSEQPSIQNEKEQKGQVQQFQQVPQPNQLQISQFESFYNFLINYQAQFLSQRDSKFIEQAIPYFDVHLLNISKSKDLELDIRKSILFLKQMIKRNCILEEQEQLNQCGSRNGHFPELQAESNKCIQCGARTKFQCKLCSYQQNRPVPLCIPDKHQRDCLKKYHTGKKLSLKFKFQQQKVDQQEKKSQVGIPIKRQIPKEPEDNSEKQKKQSKHTIQQYKLIKRLDVLNQRIDSKMNQLFRQKRFGDAKAFIQYYRSSLQLKQLQMQNVATVPHFKPPQPQNGLQMEQQ